MSFYNEHTAWGKRQLIKREDHKKAGYRVKGDDGQMMDKGYLSEIQAISLHDNPHGTRGKDATYCFMEECGTFPNLKESYWVARSTVEDGGVVTGCLVLFGTGGDMEKGTIDFHHMYYNPETYNLIPVANIWDPNAKNTWSCFFFPSYKNKSLYYDKHGNSKIEEAKRAEELERAKIEKTSNDPKDIGRYKTENAWCGREAFLRIASNPLPVELANDWLQELESSNLYKKLGIPGFYEKEEGTLKFKPDLKLKPIYEYPVSQTRKGAVVSYQTPFRNESGLIPDGIHVVVVDPFDKPVGSSLGAAYVLRIPTNEVSINDIICASYIGRPDDQDEFNKVIFQMADYYNAKIQFESDRGNILDYAKYTDQLDKLVDELEIVDKNNNVHETWQEKRYVNLVPIQGILYF